MVTDGILSTGSIEIEKVNLLSFYVPNLPVMAITHVDYTISNVPDQSNHKIISWININNDIILFII